MFVAFQKAAANQRGGSPLIKPLERALIRALAAAAAKRFVFIYIADANKLDHYSSGRHLARSASFLLFATGNCDLPVELALERARCASGDQR